MAIKSIQVRASQGRQYIKDPRQASPAGFRGKPLIADAPCASGCQQCLTDCPAQAITPAPLSIDLGRCMLCGDCADVCREGKISFDNDVRLAATQRTELVLNASHRNLAPVAVSQGLRKYFGRSMKMRSVSAGGCNACELEINALGNVNFDFGRYGIDIVASPRHADALILSGPITRNMAEALQLAWDAMPEPKILIATGACAISASPYSSPMAGSPTLERSFLERVTPTLYVPGCPAHPLSIICGILDLLGIAS